MSTLGTFVPGNSTSVFERGNEAAATTTSPGPQNTTEQSASAASEASWVEALREHTSLQYEIIGRITRELLGSHSSLSTSDVNTIAGELSTIFSSLQELAQHGADTLKKELPCQEYEQLEVTRKRLYSDIEGQLESIEELCGVQPLHKSFPLLAIHLGRISRFLSSIDIQLLASPKVLTTNSIADIQIGDVIRNPSGDSLLVTGTAHAGPAGSFVKYITAKSSHDQNQEVSFASLLQPDGMVRLERRALPRLTPDLTDSEVTGGLLDDKRIDLSTLQAGDLLSIRVACTNIRLAQVEVIDIHASSQDPALFACTFIVTDLHRSSPPTRVTLQLQSPWDLRKAEELYTPLSIPPWNIGHLNEFDDDTMVFHFRSSHSSIQELRQEDLRTSLIKEFINSGSKQAVSKILEELGTSPYPLSSRDRLLSQQEFALPPGTLCSLENGTRILLLSPLASEGEALESTPQGVRKVRVKLTDILQGESKASIEISGTAHLIEGRRIDGAKKRREISTPPLGAILHYADGTHEEVVRVTQSSSGHCLLDVVYRKPGSSGPQFKSGVVRDWSHTNHAIAAVEVLEPPSVENSSGLTTSSSHAPDLRGHPALTAFQSLLSALESIVATECQERFNLALEHGDGSGHKQLDLRFEDVLQELTNVHEHATSIETRFRTLLSLSLLARPEGLHKALNQDLVSKLEDLSTSIEDKSTSVAEQLTQAIKRINDAFDLVFKDLPVETQLRQEVERWEQAWYAKIRDFKELCHSTTEQVATSQHTLHTHTATRGTEVFTAKTVTWDIIERCCQIEAESHRVAGVGDKAIRASGGVFALYSPQELFEELRSGALLDTYWVIDQKTGEKRIEGFFVVHPPKAGSHDAQAVLYTVSKQGRQENIELGKPGLATKMLFASHFIHMQRYGAEYHIGYIEYENVKSFEVILRQLGIPNAVACRTTKGPGGTLIPWIQMHVPLHPKLRQMQASSNSSPSQTLVELFARQAKVPPRVET
jgi:hypothetical protein